MTQNEILPNIGAKLRIIVFEGKSHFVTVSQQFVKKIFAILPRNGRHLRIVLL